VITTTKQTMKSFSTFQEDLRNWFNPNHPDGNWKRVNTKGEVVGDCAREPGEPKPKCMSQSQRDSLSKKEKANAVRRKRKADPNPERQGEPINVLSKVNENMEHLDEKNEPTNPGLWSRAIAQAKSKFDVYPSAYANGWASKWYKQRGGGWKTVSEAKEKTEYDYEGDMARGQLQSIISNAQRVHDMLEDNDNIAEWVQSKITLAEDYISTVANYMMSEVDEQFDATRHTIEKDSPPSKDKVASANKQYADMAAARKKKLPQGADFAAQRRKERLASNGRMDEEMQVVSEMAIGKKKPKSDTHHIVDKEGKTLSLASYLDKLSAVKDLEKHPGGKVVTLGPRGKVKEEVELDELTKSTLGKYVNKARSDRMDALHSSYRNADDNYEADEKDNKRVEKRDRGINLARAKINKFGKSGNTFAKVKATEEVEQVDELSSDLLGRYKTGASKQASELDKVGNIKKADSRFRGIVKATKKQFDNDLKKEASSPAQQAAIAIAMKKAGKKPMNETLEEGRPSQRHPLEGHDYHKKTDDELVYIAKDAHKAADAMKSHNTSAENKYRDQANDSATVRYFRQKNGMPDWYKKKYGHVKESVEVLDGEEMQASEAIDNIQESRKKAIVREALKDAKDRMEKKGKKEEKKDAVGGKGDKFEAEPQMTSLVNDKQ